MHTIRLFVVVLSLVSLGLVSVHAGVPNVVNYQGTIKDSDGMLLTGAHDLEFSIYASESGGEALWTESHSGVTFENGVFSVVLGVGPAFPPDLFDQPDRWIGISVDLDTEMSPRFRFTSNPYSIRAAVADSVAGAGIGFPAPDFDSGWIVHEGYPASMTLTHDLGGNPDRYFVDMQFKFPSSETYKINNQHIGDFQHAAMWLGLDESKIDVYRNTSSPTDFSFRIRIWVY